MNAIKQQPRFGRRTGLAQILYLGQTQSWHGILSVLILCQVLVANGYAYDGPKRPFGNEHISPSTNRLASVTRTDLVRERLPSSITDRLQDPAWQSEYGSTALTPAFERLISERSQAQGNAARSEAADSLFALADQLQTDDLSQSLQLRLSTAYRFRDLGLDMLREQVTRVVESAPRHPAAASALRMFGTQAMLNSNNNPETPEFDEAIESFEALRRLFLRSGSDFQAGAFHNFSNSMMHLATLYSIRGDRQLAIETRDTLLHHEWLPLSEQEAINLLLANARDYAKSNNAVDAVRHFDAITRLFPTYGRENGEIVTLLHERAVAHGHPLNSEDFASLMSNVFYSDEYKSFALQRARVGNALATALASDPWSSAMVLEDLSESITHYPEDLNPIRYTEPQLLHMQRLHADALARLYVIYSFELPDRDRLAEVVEELREHFPKHSLLNRTGQ